MNRLKPFFYDYEECLDDKSIINKNSQQFNWLISADKIFSSNIENFQDYSKFLGLEFRINRFSLFDKVKVTDSAVNASDVKIYITPGRHCAMLQGRMSKGVVIPKITLKKTKSIEGKLEVLESKEFSKCTIQSFERLGEIVIFSFRYTSYSDTYTDFKDNGVKIGTAATNVDLASWKIKEK